MGKLQTLLKTGIDPYLEGRKNFKKPTPETEKLAKERAKTCVGCPFLKDEPISIFRVEDGRIPELSNKMCGDCGCTLPYKLRQSIEVCKNWVK